MKKQGRVQTRWSLLDSRRNQKLTKARIFSQITIPTILPLQSQAVNSTSEQQFSSVQSRGVTSLASKILSVLIPLNDTPFFSFGLKNGSEPTIEIAEYLNILSMQVYKKLISNNLREIAYLAIQHLIVSGDVMVIMENDYSFRVIRLDHFVIRRDVNGQVKEAIYLEFIPPDTENMSVTTDFNHGMATQDEFQTVYVRCWENMDGDWEVEKELEGEIIDTGFYDVLPFIFLRWSPVAGEDYGRSHVEDIYADIYALEMYSKAMKQGMGASSTFFMGVDPAGITEVDDLASARNGEWVAARKLDVFCISPGETLKPQLQASVMAVETMRKEVGASFLMQSAVMPTGDRVTATAIRAVGNELETILGGSFSSIAREFMIPVIQRTVFLMLQDGEIDPRMSKQFSYKDGVLNIEILTGLQSLSKESDLTKLMQMGEMIKNLPEGAASSFRWAEYARALIFSLGFDPTNWVKSDKEIQAEQEAAAQAQLGREKEKMLSQAMANSAEAGAQKYFDEKGTAGLTQQDLMAAQQMFNNPTQPQQSQPNPTIF